MKLEGKIEPIILLLMGAMGFFTVALFVADFWFSQDPQLFQVISGVLTGIVGAFLMRVKPSGMTEGGKPTDPPPGPTVIS